MQTTITRATVNPAVSIISPMDWPQWLKDHKDIVVGVAIGGCGTHPEFRFADDVMAHSHTAKDTPGWVCFRDEKNFNRRNVGLHEVAHLIEPGIGHSFKWEDHFIAIGGDRKNDPTCRVLDGIRHNDINAIFTAFEYGINPWEGENE